MMAEKLLSQTFSSLVLEFLFHGGITLELSLSVLSKPCYIAW